ncbi:MAG: endopeptidase La [Spirochaetes bacterium RBG_16_67_19]|nr:MAG: endopeptidase La [Spirochaetes bacterium RBG_16_67_19]
MKAKSEKELKRLARMQPLSPESAVLRTYLEWVADLPWAESSADNADIEHARAILDEDHYDLRKVKERVLDFIAVRLLNRGELKGPILCFAGPPGTGKTSLGKSVARALGRRFVRVSLGGVKDEAEIRGHRKTYVGALPGKILQSLKKAGTRNPVFLLDEVDKMSSDFRGDPASALLEVLDPEQNSTDEDHYDLRKVKERVLDFIAVRLLNRGELKGPILCFAGPPGTGKTSLGKSVARALGRRFVRVSLGGVKDEAEIRGHRKTYVGALPGKILQSLKKAGTRNPVFLLDEVDKMSSDFRGDPASALLEVLDPEQNSTFVDHYLEVPFDLSDVMFITTANSVHNIPHPLRDRMEIIQIPGYTEYEKAHIASAFLIPKQLRENGLAWADIRFQRSAVLRIIRGYTMESGVRSLERQIATILRKLARRAVRKGLVPPAAPEPEAAPSEAAASEAAAQASPEAAVPPPAFRVVVTSRRVAAYLGAEQFQEKTLFSQPKPGLVYGLAWTENGGTLLPVEVALLEGGSNELILTGSLGEVMKESAQTALSFLRANASCFRLAGAPQPGTAGTAGTTGVAGTASFPRDRDIHIHVPEGSIPKDGPSAGVAITAALLSAVSGFSVHAGHAMTGEITLTGRVLAIGGVKEKVLAAHRNRFSHVLLPEGNRKDVEELPREVARSIRFLYVQTIQEALAALFPAELTAPAS